MNIIRFQPVVAHSADINFSGHHGVMCESVDFSGSVAPAEHFQGIVDDDEGIRIL